MSKINRIAHQTRCFLVCGCNRNQSQLCEKLLHEPLRDKRKITNQCFLLIRTNLTKGARVAVTNKLKRL